MDRFKSIRNFLLVPHHFMTGESSDCLNLNQTLKGKSDCLSMKCRCLEMNEKCRDIVLFLTSIGRFSATAMTQVLYREGTLSHWNRFSCSFDDMIENIVYPIFLRRFENRFKRFQEKSAREIQEKLENEDDCEEYGPDCIVALNSVSTVLHKFFRKFNILNQDVETSIGLATNLNERYLGTLLSNINFLLDDFTPYSSHSSVASLKLQEDLRNLNYLFGFPGNLAFPDIVHLLGYTEGYESEPGNMEEGLDVNKTRSEGSTCNIDNLKQYWDNYVRRGNNEIENLGNASYFMNKMCLSIIECERLF